MSKIDVVKSSEIKREYSSESWIDPRIEIRDSPLHGKGMYAISPLKKGELVVIWSLPEWYETFEEAVEAAANGKIVAQIDEDLFAVEDITMREEDPTHFMNHSCDCNVWFKDAVTLIARRDIKVGEELTLDYALSESDENWVSPWECLCGSPLCRKKFTGKDWRIPELQERYKGHFSPLINKRIARLNK